MRFFHWLKRRLGLDFMEQAVAEVKAEEREAGKNATWITLLSGDR